MKIKIELTESEIREALQAKINDRIEGLKLQWGEASRIKVEGSVKFKKKPIRKLVERFIAYVEFNR